MVYTIGTLAPDCHVKSGKAFYSAPWRLMGQKVLVRTAGDVVQIFHDDTVVATHVLHLTGARRTSSTTRRTRSPTPCAA